MRKLNLWIEALFSAAMRQDKWALLVTQIFSLVSLTFRGIWLFRKGDVSESLTVLKTSRVRLGVVNRCIARSEFILSQLNNTPTDKPRSRKKPFNGAVLMAVHSDGHYSPNGYAVRTAMIIRALKNAGLSLFVTTRPGYPWDLPQLANAPILATTEYEGQLYEHHLDPDHLISGPEDNYLRHYSALLEQKAVMHDVSVIHAHSSYLNGIAASLVGSKLGIKTVYEMRGLWHLSRAVKEPLFENSEHFRYCEAMEILAAMSCDHVITLNNSLRLWLIEKGVAEGKISVVPNGAFASVSTEMKPASNTLQLGFFGSITRYEGIDDCVKAIASCRDAEMDVVLNIYGQGEYAAELKKMVSDMRLEHCVFFKGRISREALSKAYLDVDAVVVTRKNLPVTRLVTPLKLVEAMLMGKACIVSDLPALSELAVDNCNSLLVTAGDSQSIATAIAKLNESQELTNRLGEAARQTVVEKFDWSTSVQTYLDLYSEAQTSGK